MTLILQSSFAPAVMRPPSVTTSWHVCFMLLCVHLWRPESWPLLCILIPGSVTNRYVILTLPRCSTHSDTTTLTTSICRCWGLRQCFIYILVLHLHIESFFFSMQNKVFSITIFWLLTFVTPLLLLSAYFTNCSNFLKGNKRESRDGQQTNRKCFRDVLEDTLQGGQHEPQVYYLLNKQTYASSLICLLLMCLPFKSTSSITSQATAPLVL